jgi:hypothetical protein
MVVELDPFMWNCAVWSSHSNAWPGTASTSILPFRPAQLLWDAVVSVLGQDTSIHLEKTYCCMWCWAPVPYWTCMLCSGWKQQNLLGSPKASTAPEPRNSWHEQESVCVSEWQIRKWTDERQALCGCFNTNRQSNLQDWNCWFTVTSHLETGK